MSGYDDPEYMKRVRKETAEYFGGPSQEDINMKQALEDKESGISPETRRKLNMIEMRRKALMGGRQ